MGRINLSALRVRKRALANIETKRTSYTPVWADIMADVPPAQIMTRQQPNTHPLTQTRTKSLPNGKTTQETTTLSAPKPKSYKPSRLYSPTPLRYEEDSLRRQFFSDHPWELARPRVVLETTGNQHKHADWSTGISQTGLPLSGESVVQRQLYLLQNTPNITLAESYDIARREFYSLRRREHTRSRIAVEEAEMMGADFGIPSMSKAMTLEDNMYNDWEEWAHKQNMEFDAKNAAFSGQQAPAEKKMPEGTPRVEGVGRGGPVDVVISPGRDNHRIGAAVFAGEERRQAMYNMPRMGR